MSNFTYEIRWAGTLIGCFDSDGQARDGGPMTVEKMVEEFRDCRATWRRKKPLSMANGWELVIRA